MTTLLDNRLYTPIHILNDDALLSIFCLYQLIISESYHDVFTFPHWENEKWWYKLAQVCQRWRSLILASPVRLGLHLICTYGTPVADMLAHSPPFPLIINYLDHGLVASTEDEEAILLSLQHRDRVRRIGLSMPAQNLLKLIKAMDGQFTALERLFIWPLTEDNTNLMIPPTFQAPHLGMLSLVHAALSVGSPLLTTTIGLSSLELSNIPLTAYFHPSYLVERISSMPQLECLSIGFRAPTPTRHVERPPPHTLIGMHLTLPNLRFFFFRGVNAYLEGLLSRINTPLLEVLKVQLFNQLSFTVPHLFQFINKTESLKFNFSQLFLHRDTVVLSANSQKGDRVNHLHLAVSCRHVDWQVSAAAQIFNALVPILSITESLALGYEEHDLSSEQHNEINRMQWRNLLRPFNGVKALHIPGNLISHLSHSLQLENEESPLELLPELLELMYYKEGTSDTFTPFINARQIAGRPVVLIHVPPQPASL